MRNSSSAQNHRSVSYQKKIVQQNTTSKIKQSFLNLTTNISYKVGGGVSRLKDIFSSDSGSNNEICIQGKKLRNQQEAKAYIRKIIWFSYRKLPGLTKNHSCDTGWGCLIRVGQMALASGLKLHLQKKFGQKPQTLQEVIIAFVENGGKSEKYSLKKIVEYAKTRFQVDYGSWFKVSEICEVLVALHNNNPMKNAQNLQLIHFKNAMIYLEPIFQKLNKNMCQCQKRRMNCLKCANPNQQTKNQGISLTRSMKPFEYNPSKQKPQLNYLSRSQATNSSTSKLQKKVLILVSCRLGVDKIKQNQYKQLIQLLSLECSLGIIGGVPKKGLYFIGYSGDQLIYFDPHFVQDQMTLSKLHFLIRTFENTQLRKAHRNQIDPSLAFVFYIDSIQTLHTLYNKIQDLNINQNPIVQIDWVNPYKQQQQKRISTISEGDQQCNDLENSFIEEL